MDRTATQIALWRARRALLRLGWSGTAAIAAAAFAAIFFLLAIVPLQARTQVLREQVSNLEARPGPRLADTRSEDGPERQLAVFLDGLAPATDAPQILRRLHQAARETGLNFERGEYRPVSDAKSELIEYQLTLPVQGTYPQVRRFLDRAMRDTPGLALEGIGFQREQAGHALEAQLRLTLFLRKNT
jgi:hypothetical protein